MADFIILLKVGPSLSFKLEITLYRKEKNVLPFETDMFLLKRVCVCLPYRKSGPAASAQREDISSMAVQPVTA